MAHRRLAHGALEEEGLVGEFERIAVIEVDLALGDAFLVDQAVDRDLLLLAEIVDVLEQRIELVDRVDAVGLTPGLRAAGLSGGRLQRIVGIEVLLGEIEFQLRRDDRLPVAGGVFGENVLQHLARRDGDRASLAVIAVADHLRGRLLIPGHDADGFGVRHQHHVGRLVGGLLGLGMGAGDHLAEHRIRQAQRAAVDGGEEFSGGQDLAARNARHVGHQALDLGDPVLLDPFLQFDGGAAGHGSLFCPPV